MTIPVCGIVIALACTSMVTNQWVHGTSKYIGNTGASDTVHARVRGPPGRMREDTTTMSTTTELSGPVTEGTVTYNLGLFGGHKLEEGRGSKEEEVLSSEREK